MKVLIVDPVHSDLITGLTRHNHHVIYIPECNETEAKEQIKDSEILVIRSKFQINDDWLNYAPKLKIIARAGAGMDNIRLSPSHHVILIHAGGANALAVAEHTLGVLLSLTNKIHSSYSEIIAGIWNREKNTGNQLKGKTAAIVGYGNTGMAVSRIFSRMGLKVLAYDKYKSGFSEKGITESSMIHIFEQADILSLHIPLTSETRMLVDDKYINSFKHNFILLNMSRGDVVSTESVLKNMENGKLLAVGLDVISGEPLSKNHSYYNDIIQNPNILVTPHVAGWTHESYHDISLVLLDKLLSAVSELG